MAPGRILRIPLLRSFLPRGPIIPFSRPATQNLATRARSPPARLRLPLTRYASSSPPGSPTSAEIPKEAQTLTARLKALIKTHGWYALGVYTAISLLDFSLTFAVIYLIGAEQVTKVTSSARGYIEGILHKTPSDDNMWDPPSGSAQDSIAAKGGSEGLYAMIVLAYGIHKTLLLPFRIGITAAVTPKFVGFLTRRGWVGQGGARRAAQHVKDKVKRAKDGTQD